MKKKLKLKVIETPKESQMNDNEMFTALIQIKS